MSFPSVIKWLFAATVLSIAILLSPYQGFCSDQAIAQTISKGATEPNFAKEQVQLPLVEPEVKSNCGQENALSSCSHRKDALLKEEADNEYDSYKASSIRYFLAMNKEQDDEARFPLVDGDPLTDIAMTPLKDISIASLKEFKRPGDYYGSEIIPKYSPSVILYEHPPWFLTTAFGDSIMKTVNRESRSTPTRYKAIQCESFDQQPFGRCHVVFLYKEEPVECPIYEEFTFNDQGEITFIEAWTDHDGYLPMRSKAEDYWAEGPDILRLSTSIPGLGSTEGKILPGSKDMRDAAKIYDGKFQKKSKNFQVRWEHDQGPFASLNEDIEGVGIPGSDTYAFLSNLAGRHLHADNSLIWGDFFENCKSPPTQGPSTQEDFP